MKMPKTGGGGAVALATGLAGPTGIAVNATTVFWTDTGSGLVMSVPIAGGAAVTIATNQTAPFAIAADSSSVYWNNQDTTSTFTGNGTIMKAPAGGGTAVTLASGQRISRGAIAVDGQNVYWTASVNNAGSSGAVMKAPLAGGAATAIVPGGAEIYGLAIDSKYAYFVEGTASFSLMKVAK
jgi:hypothetical protein